MNILHNLTRKQILIYSIAASVIVATLAVVIFSVNFHHTYPKELVAIDSLCDSKPDSVRLLLRTLSANEYRSEPDRMYYDLLKIKVANNLYEP